MYFLKWIKSFIFSSFKHFLIKITFLLVIIHSGQQGMAQISKVKTDASKGIYSLLGDYYFEHGKFEEANGFYHKSIEETPEDVNTMLRLAEIYVSSGDQASAIEWNDRARKRDPVKAEEYILKYVFVCNTNKKYDDALKWLNLYKEGLQDESSGGAYKDTTIYLIRSLEIINSGRSDGSPVQHKNRLIFNSDREAPEKSNSGFQLYEATISSGGQFKNVRPLSEKVNATVDSGRFTIADKQNTLFFSGSKSGNNKATGQIYFCDIPDNGEDEVKIDQLSFDNFDQSVSHPAINDKGNVIYFVSENKGHGNGFDIYRSEGKGSSWSEPQLLGPNVNTTGDELYPFLYNDSILYFASNGHGGLGGLDIFKINVLKKNAPVENLGPFINTGSDDFGFFLNESGKEGYISSDRPGGRGSEDIYGLQVVNLKVKRSSNDSMQFGDNQATLSIYASGGDEIKMAGKSSENIRFSITPASNYRLSINRYNYQEEVENASADADYTQGGGTLEEIDLKAGNEYNFLIRKFVETLLDWRGLRINPLLKNLQGNPGDLIIFSFVPDVAQEPETNESWNETKVTFKDDAVRLNKSDTLILAYTVEEAPGVSASGQPEMLAEAVTVKAESLSNEGSAEPTSIRENNLAGNASEESQFDSDEIVFSDTESENNDELVDSQLLKTDSLINDEPPVLASSRAANDDSQSVVEKEPALSEDPDNNPTEMLADAEKTIPADQSMNTHPDDQRLTFSEKAENLEKAENTIESQPDILNETNPDPENSEMEIAEADQLKSDPNEQPDDPETRSVETEKTVPSNKLIDSLQTASNKMPGEMEGSDPSDEISEEVPAIPDQKEEADVLAVTHQESESYDNSSHESDNSSAKIGEEAIDKTSEIVPHAEVAAATSVSKETVINKDATPNTVYRVQIAASRIQMKEPELNRIYKGDREINYFTKDGYYKYYIAEVPDYAVAMKIRNDCGVADAFIVKTHEPRGKTANDQLVNQKTELLTRNETGEISQPVVSVPSSHLQNTSNVEVDYSKPMASNDGAPVSNTGNKPNDKDVSVDHLEDQHDDRDNLPKNDLSSIKDLPDRISKKEKSGKEMHTQTPEPDVTVDGPAVPKDSMKASSFDQTMTASNIVDQPDDQIAVAENMPVSYDKRSDLKTPPSSERKLPPSDERLELKNELKGAIASDNIRTKAGETDISPTTSNMKAVPKIQYRVQIAASKSELGDARLKQIYRGSRHIDHFAENSYVKYYIAEEPNYFAAKKILRESGLDQAFIVAYEGNVKLGLDEAIYRQYKEVMIKSGLEVPGDILKITVVHFDFDAFVLSPEERARLGETVIDQLKENDQLYAVVNGHTDVQGSDTYNFGLSEERALFVRDLIVREGIDPQKVVTHYFGESHLAQYCDEHADCDESVHQANRRVEVILLSREK